MIQTSNRGGAKGRGGASRFFLRDEGHANEVSGWMLKQKIWHIKALCVRSRRWVIHVQALPRKVRAEVLAMLVCKAVKEGR